MLAREILLALSYLNKGDWEKIYQDITDHTKGADDLVGTLDAAKKMLKDKDLVDDYIAIVDDNYPAALKNIRKPEFIFYTRGNQKLLEEKEIYSIIGGTEDDCHYSIRCVNRIVASLAGKGKIMCFTSRIGIQKAAVEKALEAGAKVIYFVPAIKSDVPYKETMDKVVKAGGLVLTTVPTNGGEANMRCWVYQQGMATKIVAIDPDEESMRQVIISVGNLHTEQVLVVPEPYGIEDSCEEKSYANVMIQEGIGTLLMKDSDLYDAGKEEE